MRVLHCCLAAFYIDDFGYQENILPKMHKLQGHEVAILASTENYINKTEKGHVNPSSYYTTEGIPITRIPYSNFIPSFLVRKLRVYEGIYTNISNFKPDIIFLHDCQFIGVIQIIKYLKLNPSVKVFADCHTDFINSGKNWISRNILHRIIYRWTAQKIEPYVKKFYGTLPLRATFYHEIYGINKNKISILPFGADLSNVNIDKKSEIRNEVRNKLGLLDTDFVLITGGKIDKRKNIELLFSSMEKFISQPIKLIIFGKPSSEMEIIFQNYSSKENIKYCGWLTPEQISELLLSSDLGIFPGTHSTIWEQSIGLGLPCIFKKWQGMEHLDLGGNCKFLENCTIEEIYDLINNYFKNQTEYNLMLNVATQKGIANFSYYNIAELAIKD